MKMLRLISFIIGLALLLASYAIGWGNYGELSNRTGIVQILMGILGASVITLMVIGITGKGHERWMSSLFVAILLLGFSALTIASIGLIGAPIAFFLLGLSIWRLIHFHNVLKTPN